MSDTPPQFGTPGAGDPTFMQTLTNIVLSGCSMNSGVFTLMGKGVPTFEMRGPTQVIIMVDDGTYEIDVSYLGPPEKLTNPMNVPGFPPPPAPPPVSVPAMPPGPPDAPSKMSG